MLTYNLVSTFRARPKMSGTMWVIVVLAVVAAGAIAFALANRSRATGNVGADGADGGPKSLFGKALGGLGVDDDVSAGIGDVLEALI